MSDPLGVGRNYPLQNANLNDDDLVDDESSIVRNDNGDLYTPNPNASSAPLVGSGRYYRPGIGREHVSGLFADRAAAENAVTQLEALGVPRSDISVLFRDNTSGNRIVTENVESGSRADEGFGTGAAIGGTLGAIIGAIAATATSIVIPGVGILIAGPIAGALAGLGAGGLSGGLIGALVGAGIPEETARQYETGINHGGVVVVADVPANIAAQSRSILGNAATYIY